MSFPFRAAGAALLASLAIPAPLATACTQAIPTQPLYHPVSIELRSTASFDGADVGAFGSATPNPFLHLRFDVYMDHALLSRPIRVPGYFGGDGQGGQAGSNWCAHFTPTLAGDWLFYAVLEGGQNLNAAPASVTGVPVQLVRTMGTFSVDPLDPASPGFRSRGIVAWDPSVDYFKYSEPSAGRFVQAGVGSPENFLGYAGFEGAADGRTGGGSVCCCVQQCYDDCMRMGCGDVGDPVPNFLHRYDAHVADWRPGDPDWSANGLQEQGRGIIGALNYLGDECGVNAIYVLVMNLGGDGKDTHPFLTDGGGADCPMTGGNFDPSHTLNYHVGRLDQWRKVLEHANDKGILVQLLLAEQEACNIRWFGAHDPSGGPRNHMSVYRRLFMKQMVAHFGHLPALRWNLCEENRAAAACASASGCGTSATPLSPQFTAPELNEMGLWIREWDPYDHPIGVHTDANDNRIYSELIALTPFPTWLSSTSLQIHGEGNQGRQYENEVHAVESLFSQVGYNIPIINDEQGTPAGGLSSELVVQPTPNTTADDRRKRVLYDVLLSGGQISYYFGSYGTGQGGGDLRVEDFRSRDSALKQLGFAHQLMEAAEIWKLSDEDGLLHDPVFASPYGRPEVAASLRRDRILVYYSQLVASTGGTVTTGRLDLSQSPGNYRMMWFDPKGLRRLRGVTTVTGGTIQDVPVPDIDGDGIAGNAITPDTDLILWVERERP